MKSTNSNDANGTHLQGYIDASYSELCTTFGEPSEGCGYKTDAEWVLKFDDGTIATIYNYKDGKAYLGEDGLPKQDIRDWHIGGFNKKAVELVTDAIAKARGQ